MLPDGTSIAPCGQRDTSPEFEAVQKLVVIGISHCEANKGRGKLSKSGVKKCQLAVEVLIL